MDLKIGKYDVVEKIGAGGFGEVFKGYDPFIKRHVAIKTCSSQEQEIRNRFFKEAEIAGNLHHRNITTVYDFGVQDGLPYLIQEYLSGEDLSHKIKRRDYLPYPEKLYYLLQIARGLAYAHSKGVIHRDIKPSNIRILEDGTAMIMDFGIARLAHQETSLTQTGMTLGTAAYLSPEQIRGEPVDQSTDIFSFGVLAYEVFVYERPFHGKQISTVLHEILHIEPPPLHEAWPAAPSEIVRLVGRCLHKDRRQRPRDGRALLSELEQLQKQGRPQRLDESQTVALAGAAGAASAQGPAAPEGAGAAAARPVSSASLPTFASAPRRSPAQTQPLSATPSSPIPAARLADVEISQGALEREVSRPVQVVGSQSVKPRPVGLWIAFAALALLAVGAGWWFGVNDRSGADAGDPPAAETAADTSAGAGGAAVDEAGAGASAPAAPSSEPLASPPPAEPVIKVAPPPPPAAPAKGVVVLAAGWTERMTVELNGRTYPLVRDWELQLDPGTYPAVFRVELDRYRDEVTRKVTVRSGERQRVASPLARPGALSVRSLPGRPQGEVWLDGALLGQSPIQESLQPPGEYRIEVRARGAADVEPLRQQVTVVSGQESIVSFDLERQEATVHTKALPQP